MFSFNFRSTNRNNIVEQSHGIITFKTKSDLIPGPSSDEVVKEVDALNLATSFQPSNHQKVLLSVKGYRRTYANYCNGTFRPKSKSLDSDE